MLYPPINVTAGTYYWFMYNTNSGRQINGNCNAVSSGGDQLYTYYPFSDPLPLDFSNKTRGDFTSDITKINIVGFFNVSCDGRCGPCYPIESCPEFTKVSPTTVSISNSSTTISSPTIISRNLEIVDSNVTILSTISAAGISVSSTLFELSVNSSRGAFFNVESCSNISNSTLLLHVNLSEYFSGYQRITIPIVNSTSKCFSSNDNSVSIAPTANSQNCTTDSAHFNGADVLLNVFCGSSGTNFFTKQNIIILGVVAGVLLLAIIVGIILLVQRKVKLKSEFGELRKTSALSS